MYTDVNRLAALDTPLGPDVLLVAGFTGEEEISKGFRFNLELLSEEHAITFEDIIGQNVTLSVYLADESQRYFNGIISSFSQGSGDPQTLETTFSSYSAIMVPWMWLLTKTTDSRIFQEKTVPEIVETVFGDYGFADYENRLQDSYETRGYCVQYRESDYNFVCRLMEEEGIHFFFEHSSGRHTLVLADAPSANPSCPGQESAKYNVVGSDLWETEDTLEGFEVTKEIRPWKYSVNDFNFKTPHTELETASDAKIKVGLEAMEVYDYPAEYGLRSSGDRMANIRMEEEEAQVTRIQGSGRCRAFSTGTRFMLTDYFRDDMNNKDYLLTYLHHSLDQSGSYVGDSGSGSEDIAYKNTFRCIPWEVTYRPARLSPRPVVEGLQTAIVVGPSGEEIYVDEHSRVKVKFHWDRAECCDETSSCWIRVSQGWGGASWGIMFIPRIGHEVIVEFEEGDPDRPLITGRVYHGTNTPPYSLPANKTMSTIKSNSSPGGGGSNELRFEDKAGSEEIYLHGQKDWNTLIENDRTHTVNHDETITIGNDRSKSVGHDQSESIGNDKTITVANNHTESIGTNMTESVGNTVTQTIGNDYSQSVGNNASQSVGCAMSQSVGTTMSQSIGSSLTQSVGTSVTETIGTDLTRSVGSDASESVGSSKSTSVSSTYTISVGAAMNTAVGAAMAEEVGGAKTVMVGLLSSETVGLAKTLSAGMSIDVSSGTTMTLDSGTDLTIKSGTKGVIEVTDKLEIICGGSSITMEPDKITLKSTEILQN